MLKFRKPTLRIEVFSKIFLLLQSNHMDLSPNYAGTLMGITNTMANIAGFVTPYIVGTIINGNVSFIFISLHCYIYNLVKNGQLSVCSKLKQPGGQLFYYQQVCTPSAMECL